VDRNSRTCANGTVNWGELSRQSRTPSQHAVNALRHLEHCLRWLQRNQLSAQSTVTAFPGGSWREFHFVPSGTGGISRGIHWNRNDSLPPLEQAAMHFMPQNDDEIGTTREEDMIVWSRRWTEVRVSSPIVPGAEPEKGISKSVSLSRTSLPARAEHWASSSFAMTSRFLIESGHPRNKRDLGQVSPHNRFDGGRTDRGRDWPVVNGQSPWSMIVKSGQ
jgi:hypothetical protein